MNPAVTRGDVDLMRRTVRVSYRPDSISLRQVAELLATLGYEPLLDAEREAGRMPAARRRLYLQLGLAGFAFGNIMLFSIPRYANGAPLEPVVPAALRRAQPRVCDARARSTARRTTFGRRGRRSGAAR